MNKFLFLVEELVVNKTGTYLSSLEREIVRGTYLGQTYERIAEQSGFSPIHVKMVGAALWEKLSRVFDEKVAKKNVRSVLERQLDKQKWREQTQDQNIVSTSSQRSASDSELIFPSVSQAFLQEKKKTAREHNRVEKTVNLELSLKAKMNEDSLSIDKYEQSSTLSLRDKQSKIALNLPSGPLELESPYYIERQESESNSYQVISQPGGLLRLKAPQKMGKTSLSIRIMEQARQQGSQAIYLNFQLADSQICQNLERLLKWFCASVGLKLRMPNQIANYWDEILGHKMSCHSYFQDYLLREIEQPLVLVLDKIDSIFAYEAIAEDFLALLRAWYEEAKTIKAWKKLRLVLVYSTEVYLPLNINQSPFNVGVSLELPEFLPEQVRELSCRYQLNLNSQEIEQTITMLGGHPYLIQIALHYLATEKITVENFWHLVTQKKSPYNKYLQQLLDNLQQHSELARALKTILEKNTNTTQLKYRDIFKLNSMGLIKLKKNQTQVSCELYRQFFKEHISQLI